MTVEKALRLVAVEYENAKKLEFVHNPLAYALYKVWKMADEADVKPRRKKMPTKAVSQDALNALNKIGEKTHGGTK